MRGIKAGWRKRRTFIWVIPGRRREFAGRSGLTDSIGGVGDRLVLQRRWRSFIDVYVVVVVRPVIGVVGVRVL